MARRASRRRSCPCGSARLYELCCGRLHAGGQAATAEELMRSRYAAYTLGRTEYLIQTTAPDGTVWQPDREAWAADLDVWTRETEFVGLQVKGAGPLEEGAWVAFEARLRVDGEVQSLEERSRFVRRDGRWMYFGPIVE